MTHSDHDAAQNLSWWRQRVITIIVAIVGLLTVIITVNANIIKFENHLSTGDIVLLELAPVDPRGFMQGDYMALSYALERDVLTALEQNPNSFPKTDGYAIVKLDAHHVGHFVRLANSNSHTDLAKNELPIYYRIRDGQVILATNAFFFQEGHAKSFEAAKYGLFRINDKGEPLLTEMVNSKFHVIKSSNNQMEDLEN